MNIFYAPQGFSHMIYMDNAATTRVKPEVFEAIKPYFCEIYGNPSSVHSYGRAARKPIENARRSIAKYLGCEAREIYFTSGGSEADSWAIESCARNANGRGSFITSQIEHKAVLNAAKRLEKQGFKVIYLPVDSRGMVSACDLESAISDDTFLVSVMAANNEVGTIQPIDELCRISHEHGALFHTDAVQAIEDVDWALNSSGIDMLSLSGHKLNAPKGTGALYVRDDIYVSSLIFGGAQERGRRGGTENTAGIVGLGKAFEILQAERERIASKKRKLCARLERGISASISDIRINGADEAQRLSGILNVEFGNVDGEALLFNLDLRGIAVSAGSACTSGSIDASHVLLAMGKTREQAHASIRFSLSDENTEQEVDEVVKTLTEIVSKLRHAATKPSPLGKVARSEG